MLPILRKELNAFFTSLIAYVIIGFFLILMGLLIWVLPGTNIIDAGYADMQVFFRLAPYLFMLLVPAITMHLLAEERKVGTLESLLTAPCSLTQIILGKYLASVVIIVLILLLTIPYYGSLRLLATPVGNIDTAAVVGSYLGLLLLAATFAAVGLCTSAFTEHQVVAFLLGVFFCFLLYQGFEAWATLQTWKSYSLWLSQLGGHTHYQALSRGVIDSRDLIYFVALIGSLLWATHFTLIYRK